jgi:predicted Zn-dependent protease with MMP-like domain
LCKYFAQDSPLAACARAFQTWAVKRELLKLWAEEEIAQLQDTFPPELRAIADRCLLLMEFSARTTNDELQGDELGLFEGANILDDAAPDEIPRIRLFLDRLWEWVDHNEQDYRDEVITTYLHELGHYLGWDEDDLAARGLG